ncbi:TetR/AcrR family transcriptional regulator [Nocardioides currus]|uniref:TetR family transcriptional regulator n=1 Tax=Nocardioides currus TaxID=2133958 RepID=A0A2R7YUY5_9ACTN|nr:TetR/AcrR family transcriptional regulator [Nocardioides currus]PUA80220.1 TetR family transcriptional regulator [Nocardioides currus]
MASPTDVVAVSTRSKIVDAAALLLREGGADAVTTRAVATAAGVPAPTIFRVFGDKDGLMDAVAEHVMTTYVATKAERASREDGDPVDDLRRAWRSHIDFGLANPDLFVLLSTPGRHSRSPASAAGATVLEARVRRVAEAGLLTAPEAHVVGLIHAAGTGAVLSLLQQPADRRDDSLPDAMLEAVLRTVLTTTPAPSTSHLAPLAIAFRTAVPDLPGLTGGERQLLGEWVDRTIAEIP